jgi:hypothetical protein
MATFSTLDFDYSKSGKMYSSEKSLLLNTNKHITDLFGRLYDDSLARGFTMISALTGTEVKYVIDHVDHMDDITSAVVGWHLVPTTLSLIEVPECAGSTVLIINV